MASPAGSRPRLLTRSFALVAGITLLTFFAAFQLFPTVPLQLRRLGASLGQSGRFMTAFTAGSSLGALVTGPLGDRMGQRRTAAVGAAGFGLLLAACGFLTAPWAFYLLACPLGVVWSGLLTATASSLGQVLPPERRADGLSLYGLASPMGVVFGPTVGLAVFQRWGFAPMVWSLALVFGVLGLLALSLPPAPPRPPQRQASLGFPDRSMLAPAGVLLATALGYGALNTYSAQEALAKGFQPVLGVPTGSAFLSCMALGMVGMRVLMAAVGFGRSPARLLPGMLWATVAGLGLLAFLPGGVPRHVLAALVYGAGYSMVHTLVNAHVLETAPPSRRGAAFGATLFAFDSGIGIGALALGALIGWACGRYGPSGYRLGWAVAMVLALAALPPACRMAHKEP